MKGDEVLDEKLGRLGLAPQDRHGDVPAAKARTSTLMVQVRQLFGATSFYVSQSFSSLLF
jgi:hypothetical protein